MSDTIIETSRDALRGMIRRLRPAMDTNDPALNGISLSYRNGDSYARLIATRREMTAIEDIPMDDSFLVHEPIGMFLDAVLLDQAASRMGEHLQIKRAANSYVLTDGSARMNLAVRGASDAPFFDVESFRTIAMAPASAVRVALARALSMTEDTSDIQGAIQIWTSGSMLYIQSVSRFRGSIRCWIPIDVAVDSYSIMIRHTTAKSLVDMLNGAETFRLLQSEAYTAAGFGIDRAITISAVLSMQPLRLDSFFSDPIPSRITIDADKLSSALQLVQTYYTQAKSDVPRVVLSVRDRHVVLSTPDNGAEIEIASLLEGDAIDVTVNAKYLQSAIHSLGRSVYIEPGQRNIRVSSDSVPYISICVMPMASR